MAWKILIAHAIGEEKLAEILGIPLRKAGYEVAHIGTFFVGQSIVEEASKILSLGGPVILCGTVKAVGTAWARKLVNAARRHSNARVFVVQMEEDADLDILSFDTVIASYWNDPSKAVADLLAALSVYYPLDEPHSQIQIGKIVEEHYRELMLETCDIINLTNLPEQDRNIVQRQLELRRLYVPLRVWTETEVDERKGVRQFKSLEEYRTSPEVRYLESSGVSRKRHQDRVAIGECLRKSPHLVVLGDPGSGKTTLTHWIATAYLLRLKHDPDWQDLPDVITLPDIDWLPIIVRCRDLDKQTVSGNLDDILHHTFRKAELTEIESAKLQDFLRERLLAGTALLILDGLDEISDPRARARFCQQIETIHKAYREIPIVATSRIVGYREMGYRLGEDFEHVTLADLTASDKDDFVRRWCALTEIPDRRITAADELIHDIHSADRIERMTGNPMLLTTMALVKRKVGKLPSRRADLYWEAVQVLLNWRREIDEPIDPHEAIPQLEYLAYVMCKRGVQQLRKDDVVQLFAQMRAEYPNIYTVRNRPPEEFLSCVEARTGLLIEAGYTKHLGMTVPVYEFRHLTFQEYLAARALVDGRFPDRNPALSLAAHVAPLAGHITKKISSVVPKMGAAESWRETLRLCTSICLDDDVDSLLLAILTSQEAEPPETKRARAILATLCIADEPNVSEKTARGILQAFVNEVSEFDGCFCPVCAKCNHPQRVSRVEEELGYIGPIRSDIDSVTNEIIETRWASELSMCILEKLDRNDSEHQKPLVGLCTLIVDRNMRQNRKRTRVWIKRQIRALHTGTKAQVMEATLNILTAAYRENIEIIPGLTRKLQALLAQNDSVSLAAAVTLFWLNYGISKEERWEPTPAEAMDLLALVSNPQIAPSTLYFLSRILCRERVDLAFDALVRQLNNPNPAIRIVSLEILGNLKGKRVTKPILAKLGDEDSSVRRIALWVLASKLGDKDQFLLTTNQRGVSFLLDSEDIHHIIDPQKIITVNFLNKAAKRIGITLEEGKKRFEVLSKRFRLQLEWQKV